ncbi:armadillo-type protein [Phycomyces blakesleeanus]|uniref:Armadillo-type protein n=1 Tax=Phycomyces blakesleeanus TaxID=4837 RepID=A0ABR3B4G6_PHYBL
MSTARHDMYKRTAISGTAQDLRQRRVDISTAIRNRHRDELITSKRFRFLSINEPEIVDLESAKIHDKYTDLFNLAEPQVKSLVNDLNSTHKKVRMDAVVYLGDYACNPSEALVKYIKSGECIKSLVNMVICEVDPVIIQQIVQVISNIAAGPYDLCVQCLPAIPYLVTMLNSNNTEIRELASYALGNMASEDYDRTSEQDEEIRRDIILSGAIPLLIQMLDSNEPNLIRSSCLTMSHLARGPENQWRELRSKAMTLALLRHLTRHGATTGTEVCWLMGSMTANSEQFRKQIIEEGLLPLLINVFQLLKSEDCAVLPALRTLGHLSSDSGTGRYLVLEPQFLPCLIQLTHSEDWVITKEALWVLSNVTTIKMDDIVQIIRDTGEVKHMAELIMHGKFEVREEASKCLFNMVMHDPPSIAALPHQFLLPAFLDFIQSQEEHLIILGLSYVELLLKYVPEGRNILNYTKQAKETLISINPATHPTLYVFSLDLQKQIS